MKKAGLFITFIVLTGFCHSQTTRTYVFDSRGNMISGTHIRLKPGVSVTLVDTLTQNRFILDSLHINITALNSKGDTLWRTDPWKDNNIMEYRVKRPVIVDFHLDSNKWTSNKEMIWIVYINTQFGTVDKATGKFHWMGQD